MLRDAVRQMPLALRPDQSYEVTGIIPFTLRMEPRMTLTLLSVLLAESSRPSISAQVKLRYISIFSMVTFAFAFLSSLEQQRLQASITVASVASDANVVHRLGGRVA